MYVSEELLKKALQVLSKYYMGAEGCWRFQDRIKGIAYVIPLEDMTLGVSTQVIYLLMTRRYLLGTNKGNHIIYSNNKEGIETFSTKAKVFDKIRGEIPMKVLMKDYSISEELRKSLDDEMSKSFEAESDSLLTMGMSDENTFEFRKIRKDWEGLG